jgi:hypothetical protein
MQREVDRNTVFALKKVQQITKQSVRSNMRGRPRWDHRGKTKDREGVSLGLNPHVVRKSGGPGRLTGDLYKSIRGSRNARRTLGTFSAVVMSGGKFGWQNMYKGEVENKYPFFRPGVAKAEGKMPAVWAAAWAKATSIKK